MNLENFCLWYLEIRENFAFKKIQNPGLWNPEYSSRNPEYKFPILASSTCNPESKTVLDFLTLGQ